MTAGSPVLADTNILVYVTFSHFQQHDTARRRMTEFDQTAVRWWTTRQVLREFVAVTTRPGFLTPMPPAAFVAKTVRAFEDSFQMAEEDRVVTALLLEMVEKPGAQGRQVHDTNIVAAMRRHEIPYLLTNNGSDFIRYQPWITVLPLFP